MNGMAMGCKKDPTIMQRTIEKIFGDKIRKCLMIYLDGFIVFGKVFMNNEGM